MEETIGIIAKVLVGVVALEHLYILWMEMFAWETVGKKTFRNFPKDLFKPTKALAANQGLYNGFLAAGLIWSLFISDTMWQRNVAVFFLSCVVVAGLFGAVSASWRIFLMQGLPALIALGLVLWSS